MSFSGLKFSIILFGLSWLLKIQAWRHPAFRARLKERNLVAQISARDEEIGRWIELHDGTIRTSSGIHHKPDVTLGFKNAALGALMISEKLRAQKRQD